MCIFCIDYYSVKLRHIVSGSTSLYEQPMSSGKTELVTHSSRDDLMLCSFVLRRVPDMLGSHLKAASGEVGPSSEHNERSVDERLVDRVVYMTRNGMSAAILKRLCQAESACSLIRHAHPNCHDKRCPPHQPPRSPSSWRLQTPLAEFL